MSKKRGLSVDEKRAIVLDIFHESNQAWLLKVRRARGAAVRTVVCGRAATQTGRKRRAARVFALGALWGGQLLCGCAAIAPVGSCSRAPSSASLVWPRVSVFSHGARARHCPPR